MKLLLLVVLGVVLTHSVVLADQIYLSSIPGLGPCGNTMPPFTPTTVYVVHDPFFSWGAGLASAWRVDNSAANVVALGSSCPGMSIIQGNPFDGIWVSYGGCRSESFVICELTYMKTTSEQISGCNHLAVLPFPGKATPIEINCDGTERSLGSGFFSFDLSTNHCLDCLSATEPTTWGSVKALYR